MSRKKSWVEHLACSLSISLSMTVLLELVVDGVLKNYYRFEWEFFTLSRRILETNWGASTSSSTSPVPISNEIKINRHSNWTHISPIAGETRVVHRRCCHIQFKVYRHPMKEREEKKLLYPAWYFVREQRAVEKWRKKSFSELCWRK